MNTPNPLHAALLAALLAAAGGAAAQAAAPAPAAQESAATRLANVKPDRDQLKYNIESVGKLLNESSAARQIESSKVPEALERWQKAKEMHAGAKQALDKGDLDRCNQLLKDARATFFDAVRVAAPEEIHAKKLEADYKARLDSVNALLGAYKRVANEKGSNAKQVSDTVAQIDKSVAEAAKLAQAGQYKEGRAELDRAYLVAKAAVNNLRSGDTVVKSLKFASKEEEYHYEVDRNDTHQMLIKVLAEEKRAANASLDQQITGFVARATELRKAAEAAAAKRDYAEAIKQLEESTAELVRAIRNAGIYIPG
jgi:hypothetical protein